MKTVGVRINQSQKNPEPKLEQYIIKRVQLGLSKDKTEAIKDAIYEAINYDKLQLENEKLQGELKKKDQQIELLYEIISKLKGYPVYYQQDTHNNSQANRTDDTFNLDIDITDDEELITVSEADITDENLEEQFLRKFG